MTVKETGKSFKLVPEGTHVARCVRVIDLGTHYSERFDKNSRKVMVAFEIPDETIEIEGENLPMMLSKEYTASLSEKSNLRADLTSWRGRAFSEEELKGFDLRNILGAACMITVTHQKNGEKTYANIASIAKLLKNVECPEAVNEKLLYDIDMGENDVYGKLPEWIQKKIQESNEFRDRRVAGQVSQQGQPEPPFEPEFEPVELDDLPF